MEKWKKDVINNIYQKFEERGITEEKTDLSISIVDNYLYRPAVQKTLEFIRGMNEQSSRPFFACYFLRLERVCFCIWSSIYLATISFETLPTVDMK